MLTLQERLSKGEPLSRLCGVLLANGNWSLKPQFQPCSCLVLIFNAEPFAAFRQRHVLTYPPSHYAPLLPDVGQRCNIAVIPLSGASIISR